ncbi:protein kinase family protein [Teredinibacter waterburyi]|uniref:protein kinase family protein n=1 Tax=Teredinibacter waterburyi TaxID=1500538 RepID=UPI00165F201A|nr:protein kinase family protein [Teredinibacter waterburyi]
MDISRALGQGPEAIQSLITEYIFERDILEHCKALRMSKVVLALDAGELTVPNFQNGTVYYLIFEKADGDLRQEFLNNLNHKKWRNAFKAIHHVSVGAAQLQRARIAHQDIKPSNVLCFSEESKLSDLGRVTDEGGRSPFLGAQFTGDPRYEPIEGNFGVHGNDFIDRYHTDIYMVGSLAYQLVTGIQMPAKMMEEARLLTPHVFSMSYIEALPILISAFNTIIDRFHKKCEKDFGEKIAVNLKTVVFEMCHPDKEKRGAPGAKRTAQRLSFERYVGKFNTLATQAQIARL